MKLLQSKKPPIFFGLILFVAIAVIGIIVDFIRKADGVIAIISVCVAFLILAAFLIVDTVLKRAKSGEGQGIDGEDEVNNTARFFRRPEDAGDNSDAVIEPSAGRSGYLGYPNDDSDGTQDFAASNAFEPDDAKTLIPTRRLSFGRRKLRGEKEHEPLPEMPESLYTRSEDSAAQPVEAVGFETDDDDDIFAEPVTLLPTEVQPETSAAEDSTARFELRSPRTLFARRNAAQNEAAEELAAAIPVAEVAAQPIPQPVVPQPVAAQPVVAEPVVAQPVVTEPVVAQPVVTQPVVTEPVVTEPVVAQPVVAQPVVTEPVAPQPVVTQPVVAEPVVSQPVVPQPVVTQPVVAEPVAPQPVVTQPVAPQPVVKATEAPAAAAVVPAPSQSLDSFYDGMDEEMLTYRDCVEVWATDAKPSMLKLLKYVESIEDKHTQALFGRECEYINAMIDRISYFTELQYIDESLNLKKYSFSPMVKECLRRFSPFMMEKRIGLLWRGLELEVTTDRRWFIFALTQILFNAVEFTSDGGKIAISAKRNGDYVDLMIDDNGTGIAKDDMPYVFVAGFMSDTAANPNNRRTGMGLFIARSVLNKMGGELYAESNPGKGTRITMHMPVNVSAK